MRLLHYNRHVYYIVNLNNAIYLASSMDNMTKIWTNYDNKGDKLIAFANNTIYKANPKTDEIEDLVRDMQMNNFTNGGLFYVSSSEIRDIQLQEGKDYIQVFFGKDSEEHLNIKDAVRREEIFNFLKDTLPATTYYVDRYSKIKTIKKPLIALAVVEILFLYTLFMAWELEAGESVMAVGRIGGLLLGIAGLGMVNVFLIYGALTGIIATSMMLKMKNTPVIHVIKMVR